MKQTFKYEMHLHTAACSGCAQSTGESFVMRAKKLGFSGFVMTNHFYHGNSTVDRSLPWKDFVGAYAKDYEETKRIAKDYDIDVFFGFEEGYGEKGYHYLVYGLSPDTVASAPEFPQMSLAEIYDFVHKNGGFAAFAHPYRDLSALNEPGPYPDMRYADAIEVYNAGNSEESNRLASEYAARTGVKTISGSDTHNIHSFGQGGLAFEKRLYTSEKMVENLFLGRYNIIVAGQEKGRVL